MSLQPPSFTPSFRDRLLELLAWRRDVRAFRREPLPVGTVERLIGSACLAPSVGLSEPWRFVIVESAKARAAIRANFTAANARALRDQSDERAALYARLKLSGLDDAPSQVAVFAEGEPVQGHGLGRHSMPDTLDFSVVMAIQTLWLIARAEGIGLGWVSILDPVAVAAALEIPEGWRFIAHLCLGYPAEENRRPELERCGWEHRRDPASRILRR